MNFLETLLSEKLKNRNPMLDIWGVDRKVLQIACQDIINYVKVHWGLIGKEANDYEITYRLEELYRNEKKELEEFIDLWAGIWLKKWGERVKLLIGSEDHKKWSRLAKILNNAEPIWRNLPNRKEMQELVISALVRNGEICGTSILSENLLKMELGEGGSELAEEKERLLNVACRAVRKAKELSRSKGPLIFVKIDKGYYGEEF